MLKINRKVEYALMCLKFMGQKAPDDLTSTREVCDRFNTPFDTMAKVMQSLNHHQVLTSVKGIKGGYRLERDLHTLTFKELNTMIEGKTSDTFCQNHNGPCELLKTCNIVTPVEMLHQKVNQFLNELTLAELFSQSPQVFLANDLASEHS
jgi:Rrf2 family protein